MIQKDNALLPVDYWNNRTTVEAQYINGQFGVKTHEFDPIKTAGIVMIIGVICKVSIGYCPALIIVWIFPPAFIGAAGIVIGYSLFMGYLHQERINGFVYQHWIRDTHNLVFELTILVTEWANFVQDGNCTTYFGRTLKRYGDKLVGLVHCTWIKTPAAYIEESRDHLKALQEFKVRYKLPRLTGKILQMKYAGQEPKNNRYPDTIQTK